jgi:hypothetical protein
MLLVVCACGMSVCGRSPEEAFVFSEELMHLRRDGAVLCCDLHVVRRRVCRVPPLWHRRHAACLCYIVRRHAALCVHCVVVSVAAAVLPHTRLPWRAHPIRPRRPLAGHAEARVPPRRAAPQAQLAEDHDGVGVSRRRLSLFGRYGRCVRCIVFAVFAAFAAFVTLVTFVAFITLAGLFVAGVAGHRRDCSRAAPSSTPRWRCTTLCKMCRLRR